MSDIYRSAGGVHTRSSGEFMMLVSRHFRPRRSAPVFDDATVQRLDMPTLVFLGGRDRLIDYQVTPHDMTTDTSSSMSMVY